MQEELINTKRDLSIQIDLATRLSTENDGLKRQLATQGDFFNRQIAMLTHQRDTHLETIKGIRTRFKVIRECFAQCEADAISDGLKASETKDPLIVAPGRTLVNVPLESAELETAFNNLGLADDSRRALPINKM